MVGDIPFLHIVYITNHFSSPDQPGAPRPWQVAKYLVHTGHEVTVVANHRHYLDERIPIGETDLKKKLIVEGFRLIGVRTPSGRRTSVFHRIYNYLAFSLNAFLIGLRLARIDMLIVGTPPIFTPFFGWMLGCIKKSYTVLEIRDFHPQKAAALKRIHPLVLMLWSAYENFVRYRYRHLVAVEPSTYESLRKKGIPGKKLTLIPNGIDAEHLVPQPLPEPISMLFSIYKNWTIVTYGGGLGIGNFLLTILEAARLSKDKKIIFFIFGEGERKKEYQGYIQENGIKNVHILPLQSRLVINEIFRRSSILIYTTPKHSFFKGLLTNKIFEYLAAARPVVLAGNGIMSDMVRLSGAGIVVPPENPEALMAALMTLIKKPSEADRMGEKGRSFVFSLYERQKVFEPWKNILKAAQRFRMTAFH